MLYEVITLQSHHGLAPQAVGLLVERLDAAHLEDGAQLQVVLQVVADTFRNNFV